MARYTYIWSFQVSPGRVDDFLRHYARGGSWEQLFRQAPGYLGTRLLRDRHDPLRFVTIDEWIDEEHYRNFRAQFGLAYESLDGDCEGLTVSEALIGQFTGESPDVSLERTRER
jgi:quinol monooxygenase YgiN